jgi:hypothetical protein
MSDWWSTPYKGGPMIDTPPLPRPCYPPSAAAHGKRPSSPGPDVEAYQRCTARAGRWPWGDFDQDYTDDFATGYGGGDVATSGIAGVQRQQSIEPASGWIGTATYNTLRSIRCPDGPNEGEMAMDEYAVSLLEQAWTIFGGSEPDPAGDDDAVRAAITEFCNQGLANPGQWDYQMIRPLDVTVDPSGWVTSDCSMSAIQAFHYAGRQTGVEVPDPAMQSYSGYGNTSYFEVDHPRVSGNFLVGDLSHYGSGNNSTHVTVCMKAGDASSSDWWSFGSEPPSKRKLLYRSDYLFSVRPPLS